MLYIVGSLGRPPTDRLPSKIPRLPQRLRELRSSSSALDSKSCS